MKMRMKIKIILSTVIFSNLFFYIKSFSLEKTYIICADKLKNWKWLKDENNQYLEVGGYWDVWDYSKENPQAVYNFKFNYFSINEDYHYINKIVHMCKNNFGMEYFIPQPANSFNTSWSLFSLNKDLFIGGNVDVSQKIFINSENIFDLVLSQQKIYYLGGKTSNKFLKSREIIDYLFNNIH
ncbi:hypothetical protein [Silvanigrella aquatica]|uniref:Uncharacterized protein n=1 Tax=Silvanigrella aquatica TaxID=1915309 RepID=A0A1L4D3D2_9BACT|nr:hypothetical protein [Silvanigrella aquatica]APJ04697.1 hypothetical protein AXG55_12610 [Silvanigrella aquatica]